MIERALAHRARPRPRHLLAILTLLGLLVRMPRLAGLPMQWDEGWSVALAALPLAEMLDLTARDVHPPLYYALLSPWLSALGATKWSARTLSALAGVVAVPLAWAAARAWWPGERRALPGLAAAGYAALAPPLVYYAGIARMYALTAPLLLLATYGLARLLQHRRRAVDGAATVRGPAGTRRRGPGSGAMTSPVRLALPFLAAVLGATAALLTFYYAGFALAGLGLAALAMWPGRWRRLAAWAVGCAVAAAPWLAYVAPLLASRIAARTGGSIDLGGVPTGMLAALDAALFVDARAPLAWLPIVAAAGAALVMGRPRRGALVAVLPTACVLAGAAVGAQAHMLAPRYAIVATPFVGLGAAWVVRALGNRGRLPAALAALAFAASIGPTVTGQMYLRTAEIVDPYDPAALPAAIAERASERDLVVFNILSLAGAYRAHAGPSDPPWTYAQLWDPVHEPPERAIGRLIDRLGSGSPAAASIGAHPAPVAAPPAAVWLALHRGTAAEDTAAYVRWVDWHLWPIGGDWAGDALLRGFVDAAADVRATPRAVPDREAGAVARFQGGIDLVEAAYTGQVAAGRGVAVALTWASAEVPGADLRVFVHAYGPGGELIAQHDGIPAAGARPVGTWSVGERIVDRHGLLVPLEAPPALTLAVGLYDPATGARRLRLGGADAIVLGEVAVLAP